MKAKNLRVRLSPFKAQVVADLVRGRKVNEALALLKFMPKKAAKELYKVIFSAASNAEANYKQDRDALIVKEVLITKGPTIKRGRPVSRGRWHPILKRTTHMSVELSIP